jgi:tetratricopeptide (TPR) repeat protein
MVSLNEKIKEANELFANNNFSKAEKIFIEVIQEKGDYADIFYKLGLISHNNENFDEAIGYFEKALKINPNYYETLMGMSITLNHIGKVEEGKEFFDRALNISTDALKELDMIQKYRLANQHKSIGDIYEDSGIYEKAIIEYKMALDLCPDFHDIREKLAHSYMSSDHFEQARNEYQYIIEKKPGYVKAKNFLALCYYKSNNFNEAKELWESVQKISPDDKFSQIYLSLLEKNNHEITNN